MKFQKIELMFEKLKKILLNEWFQCIIFSAILVYVAYVRLIYFDQEGKDFFAYKRAIMDFTEGKNPYAWTVESFSNPDDPSNHGFAYLPGLIYIYLPFYFLHSANKYTLALAPLLKIPVLFADLGIGILLILILNKKQTVYSFFATIFALFIWYYNPYFFIKNNYVFTDPLPIFFLLLSMYFLGVKDRVSGITYAFAIALKTFPILLLPIYIIHAKDKKNFLLYAFVTGLLVSLPFMTSIDNFMTYMRGAILVHSERFIQGRPFLFYISYYYKIEFFQIVPFKVYTLLATFSGWLAVCGIYLVAKLKLRNKPSAAAKVYFDKYAISIIPFLLFYLFTPVLNKTYLMWVIPTLIVGVHNMFENHKYRFKGVSFYLVVFAAWYFYYWYLLPWKDGFHIWRP